MHGSMMIASSRLKPIENNTMNAINFSYEVAKGEGCIVAVKRFDTVEQALMELKYLRRVTSEKVSVTWSIDGTTYTA